MCYVCILPSYICLWGTSWSECIDVCWHAAPLYSYSRPNPLCMHKYKQSTENSTTPKGLKYLCCSRLSWTEQKFQITCNYWLYYIYSHLISLREQDSVSEKCWIEPWTSSTASAGAPWCDTHSFPALKAFGLLGRRHMETAVKRPADIHSRSSCRGKITLTAG